MDPIPLHLFQLLSVFVVPPLRQWTVFVRGPEHEDLSYMIKRVTFQLHASFEPPNRGK
jgi:transcription initiation factor IIF auxiliary subunit